MIQPGQFWFLIAAQMLMSCIIWQRHWVLTVDTGQIHGVTQLGPLMFARMVRQIRTWWQRDNDQWQSAADQKHRPFITQFQCFPDVCVCLSWRKENGTRRTINLGPIKSDEARCQVGPRLQGNFVVWNFYYCFVKVITRS